MLRCPGSSWGFGALLKGTLVVVLKAPDLSVFTKVLSSTTVFNINNNKKNKHISKGSCDTEDWNKLHF